jgi:hypothetical protein
LLYFSLGNALREDVGLLFFRRARAAFRVLFLGKQSSRRIGLADLGPETGQLSWFEMTCVIGFNISLQQRLPFLALARLAWIILSRCSFACCAGQRQYHSTIAVTVAREIILP